MTLSPLTQGWRGRITAQNYKRSFDLPGGANNPRTGDSRWTLPHISSTFYTSFPFKFPWTVKIKNENKWQQNMAAEYTARSVG